MLRFGSAPFLECSSKGDKRFSAFYAKLQSHGGKSIEDIYQASKIFEDGVTNLTWREAKGKKAINQVQLVSIYLKLWEEYFKENPHLLEAIRPYNGFSDIFGQPNHNCQAEAIYYIWQNLTQV
jgi:hypothetical protein